MKRSLYLLVLAFSSFCIVIIGGTLTADRSKYNNDFTRIFPPHAADLDFTIRFNNNRTRLGGISNQKIFLYDRLGILIINLSSMDTTRVHMKLPFNAEIVIDSPYFFIHDGGSALLQRGDIYRWKVDTTFSKINGFTAIQPISKYNAILRTINITSRENLLKRSDGTKGLTLKKQIDGLLCTDGLLQYSKELHEVIYTYRYRNQFIRMDTNLNVLGYGKTIDTVSVAKISVVELDGRITMAKPPLAVNNDAYVAGEYLFIQSNLTARNDLIDNKGKKVIDVYKISDSSYRFSFYIYDLDGVRMDSFMIKNHKLIALFNNSIFIYNIPKKYLP